MKLKKRGSRGKIYKTIKEKEEDRKFLKRCLATDTCPNCGSELSSEHYDDGGTEYECESCGEKYSD